MERNPGAGKRAMVTGGCESLIRHVGDRPGHDFRYAINPGKIMGELGWAASRRLAEHLPLLIREALQAPGFSAP